MSTIFHSFPISFSCVYHKLLLIIYFYARFLFLIQILCAYIFCGPTEECAESRPIWSRTPFAGAWRPPFLVVSLINPEWLAWKPLVFVLERARTVNFVGSGLLRNMAVLGTRVVLRSSCLSPSPSFVSFLVRFSCSPRMLAACFGSRFFDRDFSFPTQFFFITAIRLKCRLFLCPRALHKV